MKGDRGVPVRLRFSKRGRVRFISHRDVARAFERAFRIEQLPLAFTEGFSPRPRLSFGLALPVGYESDAEYLDVALTQEIELDETGRAVSEALPEGIGVLGAAFLEPRAGSLQQEVTVVGYRVEVERVAGEAALDPADVEAWVQRALEAPRLEGLRRRKGREVVEDLRPAIREIAVTGATSEGVTLAVEVSTQPRAVRPGEIVAVLGPDGVDLVERRVLRTHQWIERDGSRLLPLEADTRACAEVGA